MNLQVLVATMNQSDFKLIDKMNLRSDVIIANQTDNNSFQYLNSEGAQSLMISTDTRGVGINRNIALLASNADILLFADDDMCYYDGTLQGVLSAFENNPEADVIIFSVDIIKDGVIVEKRHIRDGRSRLHNSMKYGTYSFAVRRNSVIKANIKFNELFGGGCVYSSGEDSLFLKSCFDNKLKVFTSSYVLGTCCKDNSSWFNGYNHKYFYDKGAFLNFCFPKLKRFYVFYFVFRFKNRTDLSGLEIFKLMNRGIKGSKSLIPYEN